MRSAGADYYDGFAATYDDVTAGGAFTANDHLLDLLSIEPPADVLDLGCGTGLTLQALHGRFPSARLTGVDYSGGMLAKAAQKVPAELHEADLLTWARGCGEAYDLVTSISVLELVDDLPALLAAAVALLRPGGTLAITYEPLVAGMRTQQVAREVAKLATATTSALTVRRYDRTDVEAMIGLPVVASRLFAAYEKDGLPVVYELLVARR